MNDDRPDFFKTCPVCRTDTPPAILSCPNCGVNLEIARARVIEGKPPKKKKNWFVSILGFIGSCFLLLLVYGIIKDVVLTPYANSPYPNSPTKSILHNTATPARPPTVTPSYDCLLWSQVTPQMAGRYVCVYGTVLSVHANYQAEQSFIYFGTEDQFFITNELKWDGLKGQCVQIEGVIELNTYKVPYIQTADLYNCT